MPYASDVAFTEAVKTIQRERGSRASYERMERARGGFATAITPEVAGFIGDRDSAYLATANAQGQPYVQHRGGPAGFIHIVDEHTLAFADFIGNRQYITTGNLTENARAFLFVMHYAAGERLKLWGRAEISHDPALLASLAQPGYPARVEQAIVFHVDALDWNCPQHIPALVHVASVEAKVASLESRIAYLEGRLRDAAVAFD
jgi:predicted pyridoxine 5'-phosphate oxidase superfamily flavin-nucleotide-binding protein